MEETSFPPQVVGELAWGHVRALLDRTAVGGERRFYAEQAARHGWSRAVLTHQMATDLYRRHGNAPTNFPAVLPAVDSDLAQEITRDAYNLEFLRLEPGFRERELEDALIEQLARWHCCIGDAHVELWATAACRGRVTCDFAAEVGRTDSKSGVRGPTPVVRIAQCNSAPAPPGP